MTLTGGNSLNFFDQHSRELFFDVAGATYMFTGGHDDMLCQGFYLLFIRAGTLAAAEYNE